MHREIKKGNLLHISTADKSNTVVIMDKEMYMQKQIELLSDTETYTKLHTNPQDNVIKTFKSTIKSLLKNRQDLIKKFRSEAPPLPYMYRVVKTHKPNNPLRPIISSVASASYKLAKWLASLLAPLLGTVNNSHIVNSSDLIEKLNRVRMQSTDRLAIFNISILFIEISIPDILQYLSTELQDHTFELPTNTIIQLVKLCVENYCFTFNSQYYHQVFGMEMGNFFSPLLSC